MRAARNREATVDEEDLIGTSVAGKYRLVRLIGRGGVGAVYEAVHAYTERRVALKLLLTHAAAHATAPLRFLREAKASATIGHRGIVEVLDAGSEEGGRLYVVFELLRGEPLKASIDAQRLSDSQAIEVTLQILDALDAAHACALVHRDIKPENVFLVWDGNDDPQVKLLDFGVARWLRPVDEPLTQAGVVIGTPFFMSPEQLSGKAVDGRADLWATGVILYNALTGALPYTARNPLALLTEMVSKGPRPLAMLRPDLPHDLLDFSDRALAENLEERFATAREMSAALRACVRRMAQSAKAETVPLEPPRGRQREVFERPSRTERPPPRRTQEAPPDRPKWLTALEQIEEEAERLKRRKKGKS